MGLSEKSPARQEKKGINVIDNGIMVPNGAY